MSGCLRRLFDPDPRAIIDRIRTLAIGFYQRRVARPQQARQPLNVRVYGLGVQSIYSVRRGTLDFGEFLIDGFDRYRKADSLDPA